MRYTQVVDGNGVVRQRWDDATRTYTEYDETGAQTFSRPYTPEENAAADADAVREISVTNYDGLLAKIPAALANNQTAITNLQNAVAGLNTISGQTFNNQTQRDNALKTNSAHSATIGQHAIALTRQNSALMRIIAGLLDTQEGT